MRYRNGFLTVVLKKNTVMGLTQSLLHSAYDMLQES